MTDRAVAFAQADLTNCDREPIHVPGSIQPYGMLIVCDAEAARISHVSANLAALTGLAPESHRGRALAAVLGERAVHDLRNALTRSSGPSAPGRLFGLALGAAGARYDAAIHQHDGRTLIELEPVQPEEAGRFREQDLLGLIDRLGKVDGVQSLAERAARQLKALLGFDRVMVYRFLENGAGQVIAEARQPDLAPFLGLHYPASDIPRQARELYKKSLIRLIADVRHAPVPLVPERDDSGGAVDMSHVALRSVSPIHIEYLTNMGVSASMSLSIVVDGELWGLVACHHYAPKLVPPRQRLSAELCARYLALQIESAQRAEQFETTYAARVRLDRIVAGFPSAGTLAENLRGRLEDFSTLLEADGVGFWVDGVWGGWGMTPPAESVPALAEFLNGVSGGRVFASHELAARHPPAAAHVAAASGLIAIPLSRMPRNYLMFFRREVVDTVAWAGDPHKPVTVGKHGERLTPRKSFDLWREEVRRQSKPWTRGELAMADAIRVNMQEIVLRLSELTEAERRRADEGMRLLNAELNHRVKNVLALVRSLVTRGRSDATSLGEFAATLDGRIASLAFAHDQIMAPRGRAELMSLVEAELAPYRLARNERIAITGPRLVLDARAYPVLALVLHEMATNASKYGALSSDLGRLEVRWSLDDSGNCVLEWTESGGPPVRPPTREGLGTTIVQRNLPHELGGEARVAYELDGVRARFVVPARHVGAVAEEGQAPAGAREAVRPAAGLLVGRSVLLVEDQLMIALDAEAMLLEHGAAHVETCGNTAEALRAIGAARPDVAVLDVNLGTGTSFQVAEALEARGVPFVFATGYVDGAAIPERWRHVPRVGKPYNDADMMRALATVFGLR